MFMQRLLDNWMFYMYENNIGNNSKIVNERRQTPYDICWVILCIEGTQPGKTKMYS